MSSEKGGRHMASSGKRESRRVTHRNADERTLSTAPEDEFEDVSSYSSGTRKKEDERELHRQQTKSKEGSKKGKVVFTVLVVVLLLVAGVIAGGYFYLQNYLLKDLTVAPITKDRQQLGIPDEIIQQQDANEADPVRKGVKNIALLGLDARSSDSDGNRSDVVMIISVDNNHDKVKMVSVLRDSDVSIRMQDGSGGSYYFDDKITHAYHYGGAELAVQTLNRNFYLDITDYVTVDFEQTAEIVDAVGGVDIELSGGEVMHLNRNLYLLRNEVENQKNNDHYSGIYDNTYVEISDDDFIPNSWGYVNLDSGSYDYDEGVYHLNGNQAVAYARIRYLDSDNVRATRQQTVLKAMLNSLRGKSKLEYPEMVRKIMPMCTTSLTLDDILELVPIMLTNFTIESMSVPGEEEGATGGYNNQGGWCWFFDVETAAQRINDFIYEENSFAVRLDDDVMRVANIYRGTSYSTAPAANDSQYDNDGDKLVELPSEVSVPTDNPTPVTPPEGEPSEISSQPENPNWSEPSESSYIEDPEPSYYEEPSYIDEPSESSTVEPEPPVEEPSAPDEPEEPVYSEPEPEPAPPEDNWDEGAPNAEVTQG